MNNPISRNTALEYIIVPRCVLQKDINRNIFLVEIPDKIGKTSWRLVIP